MDKKNKNVPLIRFKGFEEEWEEIRLGDFGDFKSNGVDKTVKEKELPINLLNYMDVYNQRHISVENCNELMQVTATDRQIKENNVVDGDVFFTPSSETPEDIGHVSVIEETLPNTCYSYHLMRYRPKENVFYKIFPKYSFASDYMRKQLVFEAQGVQRFVLSKDSFENLVAKKPSISEQQKIGSFFKELDDLIGAKEEELQKLRQLKSALLDAMFPNGDSENTTGVNRGRQMLNNIITNYPQLAVRSHSANTPRLRFRGFTAPWEKKKLSTECNFSKGRGYSKSDIQSSGIPLLLYGTMYTDYKTAINKTDLYSSFKEGALLSNGYEVVVPASGETTEDIARASAIERGGIIIGGDLNVIYPNKSISPYFLALELTHGASHKHLTKKAQGISVVHLHNSDIQDLRITIPSLPEQQLIGNFFRSQDENISATEQQISKLKTMKQACLQQMFV